VTLSIVSTLYSSSFYDLLFCRVVSSYRDHLTHYHLLLHRYRNTFRQGASLDQGILSAAGLGGGRTAPSVEGRAVLGAQNFADVRDFRSDGLFASATQALVSQGFISKAGIKAWVDEGCGAAEMAKLVDEKQRDAVSALVK